MPVTRDERAHDQSFEWILRFGVMRRLRFPAARAPDLASRKRHVATAFVARRA